MANADVLKNKSRLSRAPVSRGLAAGGAVPFISSGAKPSDGGGMLPPSIDRDGGDYGAGLVRGASLLTRGEALGHEFFVDDTLLAQARDAINAAEKGVKGRFTHPGMSGDGLGSYTGRWKNASIDGDSVRADLHLSQTSHRSPDGDLGGYVMDLAQEDPAAFGTSIVFDRDWDEEEAFAARNMAEGKFRSPDKLNAANLVHGRLKQLKAADVVDSPAANPDGLFPKNRRLAAAEHFSALASYALGLSNEQPTTSALGAHPDRVREFVSRFLESNSLTVVRKDTPMPESKATDAVPAETKPPEVKPAEAEAEPVDAKPPEAPAAEAKTPEAKPAETAPPAAPAAALTSAAIAVEVKRYNDAFGPQGAIWLGEGKTFEESQVLFTNALKAQNAELAERIKKAGGGQAAPLSFGSAEEGEKNQKTPQQSLTERTLGPNVARFAAGIKLPGAKK